MTALTGEAAAPAVGLATRGLVKVYPGGLRAVDGVDLDVRPGEVFGLLGPNGAGKTTTIGMLTTRVVPTAGTALVGGVDIVADPVGVKLRIGVVPQTNTLDRSLTVAENLHFHGRYFGFSTRAARERTAALLARFRLADRGGSMVGELSGGMAQRLMVARAIFHRPAVLFLDEPTTGLDPQSRLALWELLRELHADGQTVLLTTHHMEEAEALCDRVAIMDAGRILALDTPAALRRDIAADTIAHLAADDDLDALARLLATVARVTRAEVHDEHVRVFAADGDGLLPRLIVAAANAGFDITDASVSEPTLETVFITLTGKDLRE